MKYLSLFSAAAFLLTDPATAQNGGNNGRVCFDNVNQAAGIASLLFANFNLAQYPTGCDEEEIVREAFEEYWAEDAGYFLNGQPMFANRQEIVAAAGPMAAGLCASGAYISYYSYQAELIFGSTDTFIWKANVILNPPLPAGTNLGRIVEIGFRDNGCQHPEIRNIDFVPDFPMP